MSEAKISYLPVPVTPINETSRLPAPERLSAVVSADRFDHLIPRHPTRRERTVGREIAYRAAVQEGHARLQQTAAIAIAQMHDHTHQVIVAGVITMNDRIRSIVHDDDRTELALITGEQKLMFVRHQFGNLEAGAFRVAAEVDRELYVKRRRGIVGGLLGD